MAFLIDTNVLVYRFDPRFPRKQSQAQVLMRDGLVSGEARISHQSLLEFVSATTRPQKGSAGLLTPAESRHEAECLARDFPVVYPTEAVFLLALRGAATYRLSWFDAHQWAFAEHYGLSPLYTEDLQHDRIYGTVHVIDPFR